MVCYVDFDERGAHVVERLRVFNKLCLLLMLLRVFGSVELRDVKNTGAVKIWYVDWNHVRSKGRRVITVR